MRKITPRQRAALFDLDSFDLQRNAKGYGRDPKSRQHLPSTVWALEGRGLCQVGKGVATITQAGRDKVAELRKDADDA